jgi:hypothetical protein
MSIKMSIQVVMIFEQIMQDQLAHVICKFKLNLYEWLFTLKDEF